MKATIIKASELKVGDEILCVQVCLIVELAPAIVKGRPLIIRGKPRIDASLVVRPEGDPMSTRFHPDELVTRIDPGEPEPVEVREYWNLEMRASDIAVGRRVHSRESLDHILKNRGASTVTIEHVRETVLSRETVLPEGGGRE